MMELQLLAADILGEILIVVLFMPAPIVSALSAYFIGKYTRWYLGVLAFIPINFSLVYLTFVLMSKFAKRPW